MAYQRPYNHSPAKQWATIINVNPSKREVQARLRDGGSIAVSLFEFPPTFRWPEEGEIWTVTKDAMDATHWVLGARVHNAPREDEVPPIHLSPGQMHLDAHEIFDRGGNPVGQHFVPIEPAEAGMNNLYCSSADGKLYFKDADGNSHALY